MLARINQCWLRAKSLLMRRQLDRDLDDELAFHLAQRERQIREAGTDRQEARYAARRQFGNATSIKERSRANWTFGAFETLWQDLRYGARMLRRNPGFTLTAILTLALGIGANTALFSVINTALFSSLPYRQPDRLVALARGDSHSAMPTKVSFAEVEDWKARSSALQDVALYREWTPALSGLTTPELVYGLRVTRNFFEVLGTGPFLGRSFSPEEDRPNRWHVVVLSYPFWLRQFAGNPNIVGQTILLDQVSFQVIGVLPKDFEPLGFTDAGGPPDVWAPLGYDLSLAVSCRTCQHLRAVARLSEGVSIGAARAAMNAVMPQLAREFPKDYSADAIVLIQPLRESWYGKISTALWLLWGATTLVLLIACSNIANLLLAQSTGKRREVALRSVLGATRTRIVRQLLTESTLLSLLGGVAGAFVAVWGTAFLVKWTPADLPRMDATHSDPVVLAFALGLTLATGILMGLVPALESSRADYGEALQQSSRGVRGLSRSRVRGLLVSLQVCLAFVLTVSSGLLLKSFVRVWNVDPGFHTEDLFEINFRLFGFKYTDGEQGDKAVVLAQTEALERIRKLPGVDSITLVSTPPFAGWFGGLDQAGFIIQDRRVPDPSVPYVDRYIVSPDYFHTVGIPLLYGRLFTQADADGNNRVAIISEMAARQIFGGENPLGKRIQLGGRQDDRPWAEIVGVVGDVHQYGLDSPTTPQAYLLYTQDPYNYATVLLIRSKLGSAALTHAIQEQIWAIDKNTLIFNPAWMTEILSHSLIQRRFTMSLLAAFGALALLLAAIGIYGVMSYTVAQRTGEIGVRMALGAQARDILQFVSRDGLLRAALGLAAGLLISFAVTRLLAGQLFAVGALDPITFATVLLLLAGVALAACYVPARRASCVDPLVALRHE
jgi:putative ABC transport system permease protein